MTNEPESEVDTSSEAVALIADARGLPNPERNLLSYNERELIRLVYRMAGCMEALAKERDTANARAEAAEEELAELEGVLQPLIDLAKHHAADAPEWSDRDSVTAIINIGDLRAVTAALGTKGE